MCVLVSGSNTCRSLAVAAAKLGTLADAGSDVLAVVVMVMGERTVGPGSAEVSSGWVAVVLLPGASTG